LNSEIMLITGTAALIGLVHTLLGPDHYLPFIALSKARSWGAGKTALITALCGLGHILSSVALGFAGIALGVTVFKLQAVESIRGEIAGWFLIAFGFTYMAWGLHRALRNRRHEHAHVHMDGEAHVHPHTHVTEHSHVHAGKPRSVTPWILFTIFVFGPCEPLIPLVMYPAAKHSMTAVLLVSTVFGLATLATMLAMVLISYFGFAKANMPKLERYSHALAGFAILACGAAVKLLGL